MAASVGHLKVCMCEWECVIFMQDRIHEHAEEFLDLMASDDVIFYFCGLKRMYTSVLDMLEVSLQPVHLRKTVQASFM